jgi:molybdate transport system regulatory protein
VTTLTLRLDFANGERLGPGKVALLEEIARTGSISAAGRALGMSYRRAWELVDSLNRTFRGPVVATRHGGERGGGAALTPFGLEIVAIYRRMQQITAVAIAGPLAALESELAGPASHGARSPGGGSRRQAATPSR